MSNFTSSKVTYRLGSMPLSAYSMALFISSSIYFTFGNILSLSSFELNS